MGLSLHVGPLIDFVLSGDIRPGVFIYEFLKACFQNVHLEWGDIIYHMVSQSGVREKSQGVLFTYYIATSSSH